MAEWVVRDGSAAPAKIVAENTLGALSRDRLKILEALAREPAYPAELAKRLKQPVQTTYYHVRLLQEAGLVELAEYEARGGAMAKKYRAAADALAVIVNERAWKPFAAARKAVVPKLFTPFVDGGQLNAKIVIGAPDPHGKYRARGSEFCAAEISMLLGAYASFSYPLYLLDTEVKERHKKENLILVGGMKVNTLVEDVNKSLPIFFDERTFNLESRPSGKKYGEGVGVVELIDSPFARGRKILLVGGTNQLGTRAAVLALLKKMAVLEKGNTHDAAVQANVVGGFDEDADGIVDAVEIYE